MSGIVQPYNFFTPATSPAVRRILSFNPNLPNILRSIDRLRGAEREEELQRVIGVGAEEGRGTFNVAGTTTGTTLVSGDAGHSGRRGGKINVDKEDERALREFAKAIESAVRGDRSDVLGLDWEGMETGL